MRGLYTLLLELALLAGWGSLHIFFYTMKKLNMSWSGR